MSGLDACTLDTCPIEASIFEYRPSIPANVTFLALFGVSGIIHLIESIIWRSPLFSIPILIGCIAEIIGYVGRIILYNNPFSVNGFLIQICCITIAPAFYTASIYFCLADIVRLFGVDASRLKPTQYAWIFIPCDLISLILQGTGGGMASVATENHKDATPGTNIMVAGLAFQVFSLLVFIVLVLDFTIRVLRRGRRAVVASDDSGAEPKATRFVPRWRLTVFTTFFSAAILFIFIRCCYRVAELSEGWTGKLIKEEGPFIALEGAMVAAAVFALNVSHPHILRK